MHLSDKLRAACLCLCLLAPLWAGESPSIAVLNFKGDQNVTPAQLDFITGKFASELIQSGAFKVLERNRMDLILSEQGFQQSGSCNSSECQLQMGQLLGVDALVSGNMVRFGKTLAFRVEYIDVGTGQIQKTVELEEKGELEDVYKSVCRKGAEQLIIAVHGAKAEERQQQAQAALPASPSKPISFKRKLALGLWGTSLAGAGAGYYFDAQGASAVKDYDSEYEKTNPSQSLMESAYSDIGSNRDNRDLSYGISGGAALAGLLLWFWPEGK